MATAHAPKDVVALAKLTGAYGVKGWVRASTYAPPSESGLLSAAQWYLLDTTAGNQPQKVGSVKVHGAGASACLIAQLAGVSTKEQADALKGVEVGISRADFPQIQALDSYYQADLIGLNVVSATKAQLGTIRAIDSHGAAEFMIVKASDGGSDLLIPFVSQYILEVDVASRSVRVDWELAWSRGDD